MPLTKQQLSVLEVLRPFRTQDSYVGGGAALNQKWPRISDDLDIFSDDRRSLPDKVAPEIEKLKEAGFSIELTTEDEWMVEAIIREYGFETKVQWLDEPETSKRFFPAVHDDELGFRLHQADVAVNKVLCASRRNSAARDAVDLVNIARKYAPLGPLIWALSSKDVDVPPPQLVRNIRQNVFGYADEEIRAVRMEGEHISRDDVRAVLGPALDRAAEYCESRAPVEFLGCLFVDKKETPVEADETALSSGEAVAMRLRDFGVVPKIVI
ncbi:MAG: hypothetical protein Kow00133_20420 [Amphiplicatus sp.]